MEIQEFIHNVDSLRKDLLRQAKYYISIEDYAEDVVQETLMKLWIAKEKIDDKTKMKNMASVICRNVSLNILRSTKKNISIEYIDHVTIQYNPQIQLEEDENQQKLKKIIQSLSDKQRAILKMRNVDNLSYVDIAKLIGTTESSVRGMISKARLELLKKMKDTIL